jgi:hypothetical protein
MSGLRATIISLLVALTMVLFPGFCVSQGVDTGITGEVAEVVVGGQVVIRLSSPAGGLNPYQRAAVIASRLAQVLERGKTDFQPGVMEGEAVVVAGESLVATADPSTAASNELEPSDLAHLWADNLRTAIGVEGLRPLRVETGIASWYGREFNGRHTASGEVFNENLATAAHRYLPFGTLVRVTNLNTNLSVTVRINDRGPFIHGRIIDLSAGAARLIGLWSSGLAPVKIEIMGAESG